MIISIEEVKKFIKTNDPDAVIEAKLQALEMLIRKYTNNNFQKRSYRRTADIVGSLFVCDSSLFKDGDTIQVSNSQLNEGLVTVKSVNDSGFEVNEDVVDESNVLCTKIEYPMDVKMGVVNMLKWDLENREKVGIQSETISRHSVTYFDMGADNSTIGFPKALIGFLKPYMKARF